jgi:biotin carboxyl carrier protein
VTDHRAVRVSAVGIDPAGSSAPSPSASPIAESMVVAPPAPDAGPAPVLTWLDAERAVLIRPDAPPERVLLLPPTAAHDGAGAIRREVVVGGWRIEVEIESAARAELRERARRGREEAGHTGPTEVHAIIPGVVVSVSVGPGDDVVAGQQLLAVEAMKMQNELRAPRDGVVDRVAVAPGSTIEVGDLLLVIS